jgi:hypothetical protein
MFVFSEVLHVKHSVLDHVLAPRRPDCDAIMGRRLRYINQVSNLTF